MVILTLSAQVSAGAVWSVGGTAPGSVAVDGGRGQYMGSGTNAPLYTMPFVTSRPRSEDSHEKHEGRLAKALNIDRIQRVLGYDRYSTYPYSRSKDKSHPSLKGNKTSWTGSEWLNERRQTGTFLTNYLM